MAENSRGQNRNGNRRRGDGPTLTSNEPNRRNRSSEGSSSDRNLDRVKSDNRVPGGSHSPNKINISATDYDGQLSDE